MSFFTGKNKTIDSTPTDLKGARAATGNQVTQGLNGDALAQAIQGGLSLGNPATYSDNSFFLNNLLKPYTDLFNANRASALGQAKASAGNLTGSGYTNGLGAATAQSLAQQNATIGDVMTQLRGQNLQAGGQQFGNVLNFLSTYLTHPAGQQQMVHSPGLFDAIAPILGQAAGAYFGGKGFQGFGGNGGGQQPTFGGGGYGVDQQSPFFIPGNAAQGYRP